MTFNTTKQSVGERQTNVAARRGNSAIPTRIRSCCSRRLRGGLKLHEMQHFVVELSSHLGQAGESRGAFFLTQEGDEVDLCGLSEGDYIEAGRGRVRRLPVIVAILDRGCHGRYLAAGELVQRVSRTHESCLLLLAVDAAELIDVFLAGNCRLPFSTSLWCSQLRDGLY